MMDMVNLPNAQKVTIETESGIAMKVFIDDMEVKCVTDVDISYGVQTLPKVKIELFAREVEMRDKRSGDDQNCPG